jgi:hypothetical protein
MRLGAARDEPGYERARTGKWAGVALYAAAAVVMALLAVFLPGPEQIRKVQWLYLAGVAGALAFVGFRFKRSAGVLLLAAMVLATVLVIGLLTSVRALTGEQELAMVRALAVRDEMILEVKLPDEAPQLLALPGTHFAPVVKVVIFDDTLVVLGASTWWRLEGIVGFATSQDATGFDLRTTGPMQSLTSQGGIAQWLWDLIESNPGLWGVKSAQIEVDLKRARPLQSYRLLLQNDGGLQIAES